MPFERGFLNRAAAKAGDSAPSAASTASPSAAGPSSRNDGARADVTMADLSLAGWDSFLGGVLGHDDDGDGDMDERYDEDGYEEREEDDKERGTGSKSGPAVNEVFESRPMLLDHGSCSEDELESGRTVAPWDSASFDASPSFVAAFDATVAICPAASDDVRQCVEVLRATAMTAVRSLRTSKLEIEGICQRALRILQAVVGFESKRYARNEPVTPSAALLRALYQGTKELHGVVKKHARCSLVKRNLGAWAFGEDLDIRREVFDHIAQQLEPIIRKRPPGHSSTKDDLAEVWKAVLSSHAHSGFCDDARIAAHNKAIKITSHEAKAQDLLLLYPLIRGSCILSTRTSGDQQVSEADWRADGNALPEQLEPTGYSTTPEQQQIASGWLAHVVAFDTALSRLQIATEEQVRQFVQHAIATVRMFGHANRHTAVWHFEEDSTEVQAFIVALVNLALYEEAITFAELAAMHLREQLDATSTEETRFRFVNGLATLSFVQAKGAQPLRAYHAAEAAKRILQPIFAQEPTKHAGLMGRLCYLSYYALKMLFNKALDDRAKRELCKAIEQYEVALEAEPDSVEVKLELATALRSSLVRNGDKPKRVRIVELYRQLTSAGPLLFQQELATVLASETRNLANADQLLQEAATMAAGLSTFRSKMVYETIALAYRHRAEEQAEAHKVREAIATLKTEAGYAKKGRYPLLAKPDILFQTARLQFRLERYGEALENVEQAAKIWMSDSWVPDDVRSRCEYIDASARVMRGDLWGAEVVLERSLSAMRAIPLDPCSIGVYIPAEDPDYALALAELGVVQCARARSMPSSSSVVELREAGLRNGREAVRLAEQAGYYRIPEGEEQTPTREVYSSQTSVAELEAQCARLHLLYGFSLLRGVGGRLAEAAEQMDNCLVLLCGAKDEMDAPAEGSWADPVFKMAMKCKARILRDQGEIREADILEQSVKLWPLPRYLSYLAPFRG
ncbi:hypothetical protein OC835_001701 [Tilletia horrida]|nr:hypothetical protein OC835_001701 [Tilletia horrida]